jgi:probable F420-dependent oxidoreductase
MSRPQASETIEAGDERFPLARFGLWTGNLDAQPMARSKELAVEIEEMGYGAIWLPEVAGRDVFVHLGLLLSVTSTIVGATGIASIYARDPIAMTGAVKGLTEAYPERVLVGLGVSHAPIVEGLRGHDYSRPVASMRAYLDAMEASPYTAMRPTTPVRRVIAALGPKMLALAAEKTDGSHPYLVPPEHTAVAREAMGEGPLLCPEQMYYLETDPVKAREVGRKALSVYLVLPNYTNNLRRLGFGDDDLADGGSDRLVDAIVAWGSVDDVAARVRAHLDAGADHVCVQALTADRRELPLDQWKELAPALAAL